VRDQLVRVRVRVRVRVGVGVRLRLRLRVRVRVRVRVRICRSLRPRAGPPMWEHLCGTTYVGSRRPEAVLGHFGPQV